MTTIRSIIKGLGASFGVDIQRAENTLGGARSRLFRRFGTNFVIDVGANRGQYGSMLRDAGFHGRILSFEPIPGAFAQLAARAGRDPCWEVRCLALAEQDGCATLHVAENLVSSSLLRVTEASIHAEPATRTTSEIRVPVSTLDAQVQLVEGEATHLKLDTQGFELAVLLGAARVISEVQTIECELSLVPLYEGQPLFHQVIEHLYREGFIACWLERGFQSQSGDLLQVDALFVRRDQQRSP